MRTNRFSWYVILAYATGLAFVGWHFRHALNSDAVAYLRIAEYYARAKWDLCVSGYWGPLASWIMAVPIKMGFPPLITARLFMGLSAIAFYWGCISVYRVFQLPERWVAIAAILTALAGLYWSVQFVTPDLLLAGWISFAASRMLGADGFKTASGSLKAGLFWGLAYLTKAIAFPLAIVTTLILGVWTWRNEPSNRSVVRRNLGLTLLAFTITAGPWVLVLSLNYRTPTFSTTPGISHTLTGPPDMDRYHPFVRSFHPPSVGRITDWEEPSRMAYHYWSPFENRTYALHQVKVLARNTFICLTLLAGVNLTTPLFLIFRIFSRSPREKEQPNPGAWKSALVVPGGLFVLYLPCFVTLTEQRFFYAAFPFLLAAPAAWLLQRRGRPDIQGRSVSDSTFWWYSVPGVIVPLLAALLFVGDSPRVAGDCAVDLAERIERANLSGPVAGSASLPGGRTGLYLAFLLDQPWCGDALHPAPDGFKTSGARLAIVARHSPLAGELDREMEFTNLDSKLFPDPDQAEQCPVKVYRINPQPPVPDQ